MNTTAARIQEPTMDRLQTEDWDIAHYGLVGLHHTVSQDRAEFRDSQGRLALAVADGVGGGARGDIAAQALASHCINLPSALFDDAQGLESWMALAEAQVQHRLRQVTFAPGASTLAAVWLNRQGEGYMLRIGDCRIYLCQPGRVEALQADQTYEAAGKIPPEGVPGNSPTQMVGSDCLERLELRPLRLPPNALLLLCSDGLHTALDDKTMADILAEHGADLPTACVQLAQAAQAYGSEDDITVMLARHGVVPERKTWLNLWRR